MQGTFPSRYGAARCLRQDRVTMVKIAGQPRLSIAGRDGCQRPAVDGRRPRVPIIVDNDGTAPADNIDLSARRRAVEDHVRAKTIRPHRGPTHPGGQTRLVRPPTSRWPATTGGHPGWHRGARDASTSPRDRRPPPTMGAWSGSASRRGVAVDGGRGTRGSDWRAAVITAPRLTKRYGASIVVDGIDFRPPRGRDFCLWGRTGAGRPPPS